MIKEFKAQMERFRAQTIQSIQNLPDNQNITPISGSPRCFTVKLSELVRRNNFCPRFHDFKYQYKLVCEYLKDGDFMDKLDRIIKDERVPDNRKYQKLHPEVVDHLKELL